MIDAPDHAAQERDNRSTGAWLLVALLGIALSVVAGMMSYDYTTAQAEQRFADVVDYVATQSLSYDAFNSAYTTKNLIRVMEIAGEAARDMERDGSVDNAMLEQYADQFNVSALIVTDASGIGVRVLDGRCGLRVARYVSKRITRAGGGNSSA